MDWWKNPRGFSFFPPEFTNMTIASLEHHHFCQQEIHRLIQDGFSIAVLGFTPRNLRTWTITYHLPADDDGLFTALLVYLDVPWRGLLGSTGDRIDGFFHLEYL